MDKIMNLWNMAVATYEAYSGNKGYVILFLLALSYIVVRDKDRENQNILVLYPIAILGLVFFPIFVYLYDIMLGYSVYWRIFWLLPVTVIIGYAGTKLVEQAESKKAKFFILTAILAVILVSGKGIYTKENFTYAENAAKIPQAAFEVCERATKEEEHPYVIVPNELTPYIRQADSDVHLFYGRDLIYGWDGEAGKRGKEIAEIIAQRELDTEKLVALAREEACQFIVFNVNQAPTTDPAQLGFTEVGRFGSYIMYQDTGK